ncbi:TPA: EAL domain-containing protein [Photobacterium damselae]|uniref:EAL domain-containing protein n=1 Tax=Photobacterium damselae TaxID=38293 RepID=UPI001592B28B|nr:EAL domain-containing protein [Photobacterium damselae]EHA1081409.1 EAL domain-containing protein [Photobacterium damselae]NVH52336.1 EAL domain-containing protein [Photobacterium damselae subsp. damselae]NVO82844.1 EAL domain-containing protein [Photobacterium damselae subsp. damselae]
MDIEKSLLSLSIDRNRIKPYLQPIVNKERIIVGFEVLSRWEKSRNTVIVPSGFIDILKSDNDLLIRWGFSLVNQLIDFFSIHKRKDIDLHINIYSVTLSKELIERLVLLNSYVNVVIEILEDDLIIDEDYFMHNLNILRINNIRIAMDDFGCGLNNTERLSNYQFDILKIDRKFIFNIDTDNVKLSLVKSINTMSCEVGLITIAEGIESIKQFEVLKSIGIEFYQGFLFFKPMPLDDILNISW